MITPRQEIIARRKTWMRRTRTSGKFLKSWPDELLDLEVDSVTNWESGGVQKLALEISKMPLGMLSTLLSISVEEETKAQKGWQGGTQFFDFTLPNGLEIRLSTNVEGCKKYKVLEKVNRPQIITVCGKPDLERYVVVEELGEADEQV